MQDIDEWSRDKTNSAIQIRGKRQGHNNKNRRGKIDIHGNKKKDNDTQGISREARLRNLK